jgi:hypothetical protein
MVAPNKEGLYYLATPYSHPSPRIKKRRYNIANKVAASMIKDGYLLITPIASSAALAKAGDLAGEFWQWAKLDLELVSRSDGVIVLDMPGWRESVGVAAEVMRATSLGIPVWLRAMDGTYVQLSYRAAQSFEGE